MGLADLPRVTKVLDNKGLSNIIAMLVKELEVINGRLDVNNIRANGIETKNLKANAITTDKLAAGAVTAEKITVEELSAIAADLGIITAGSITTNAEINVGTDARIGRVLYLMETDGDGLKGIIFSNVAGKTANIEVQSGDIAINAGGFIAMNIGSSQGLVVNQKVTAPVINGTTGVTINGQACATEGFVNTGLAGKANSFTGYSGGIPAGASIICSNGVVVGYV